MSEIKNAMQNGFKTISEFNDYRFEKNFKEFKSYIRNNHLEWEDISVDDIKRLFIYKMLEQGCVPNELGVSDYLSGDYGAAPIENYFSNAEIEVIKTIEELNEEEFNFQRNLGINTIMKLLKEAA